MLIIVVAAVAVPLVLGSLVLSGRLWAGTTSAPPSISPGDLRTLEARALHLPALTASTPCPASLVKLQDFGLAVGDGPVFLVSHDAPALTAWGGWAAFRFDYGSTAPGVVLIRARDLKSGQTVMFTQSPLGPSAIIAVGPTAGSDRVLNHSVWKYSEAAFKDAAHTAPINKKGGIPLLVAMLGLERGASGCVGLQFDGPGFTETMVIQWTSPGL